ncbi:hypothetical protein HUJ04_004073 [Dendroctonus ponderosae]
MKIAVEGCAHGELDNIYASLQEAERRDNIKVDLLICCGDFQSSRNVADLACMAVPPKYRKICTFYKYFSGEKVAPVLTIFIGGNHEASNYLQELPYGGWVAPKIYYMGYVGVINIAGVRIGGLSGIYKSRDFMKGRCEKPPYDENSKRSVYHIRNLDVFRLKQISEPIDVFLSHDWPTGVYHHGNVAQLLRRKPFFREEIDANQLGSKPCEELLHHLKPKFWFSAHLHCKFAALVPHEDSPPTKFLALDKCLPKRQFLQLLDIPHNEDEKLQISYDLEWLTILHLTNHLLNVQNSITFMPGAGGNERFKFTPTDAERELIMSKMNNCLKVPENFRATAASHKPGDSAGKLKELEPKLNPQTVELCETLGIDDPIALISQKHGLNISLDTSYYETSTFIADSDESSITCCNEDSDIVEQESKINALELIDVKRLTPMKLPQPKLTAGDVEEVDSAEPSEVDKVNYQLPRAQEEVVPLPSQSTPEETADKASPKRVLEETEEIVEAQIDISEGLNDSVTSTTKKFKRRNESIYASSPDS